MWGIRRISMDKATKKRIHNHITRVGGNRIVKITKDIKLKTRRLPGTTPRMRVIAGHSCFRKKHILEAQGIIYRFRSI